MPWIITQKGWPNATYNQTSFYQVQQAKYVIEPAAVRQEGSAKGDDKQTIIQQSAARLHGRPLIKNMETPGSSWHKELLQFTIKPDNNDS